METNRAATDGYKRAAFYESLPKKRMAAGALITDADGRVLLVKPRYKDTWHLPGGVVELDESPLQWCLREVKEEIGLDLCSRGMLTVDYSARREDGATELLEFIFDCGTLSPGDVSAIRLAADELERYEFVSADDLFSHVTERMLGRILRSIEALRTSVPRYLENQVAVGCEGPHHTSRVRVQAIVCRDERFLLGYSQRGPKHFFLGGAVERGESPEVAVLRELREEANVEGKVAFRFTDEPFPQHITFLVDIGTAEPTLGIDPEEAALPPAERGLQQLLWINSSQVEQLTPIDRQYLRALVKECRLRRYTPPWLANVEGVLRREDG